MDCDLQAVISAKNINIDKTPDFEAYVKVEMRGEDGMVKARTALGKWDDANNVKFDETLRLPIPRGAEEIRLKVCKDKKRVFLGGSNVVSNAGIYLRDLLRFVPIEKDFGLFRPTDKAQGGTIKMFFDYKPSVASDDKAAATTPATGYTFSPATPSTPAGETTASSMAGVKSHTDDTVNKAKKKKGFPVLGLLLLVGAGVGAYFGLEKAKEQDSKGKKPAGKPSLKKK